MDIGVWLLVDCLLFGSDKISHNPGGRGRKTSMIENRLCAAARKLGLV